jgi:hypothetical protein
MWAAALAVFVLMAVFGALQVGMRGAIVSNKITQFTDQGTSAIRVMDRYIRQAMILSEAQNYYLRFSTEKPSMDNENMTVEFRLYNRVLYINVDGKTRKIAENVRNQDLGIPVFRYYTDDNVELTDQTLWLSQSKIIKITLIIDDNLQKEPEAIRLEDSIFLRNFSI